MHASLEDMWLWACAELNDLNEGWVDWDTGLLKVQFVSPSGQSGTGVTNVIFSLRSRYNELMAFSMAVGNYLS